MLAREFDEAGVAGAVALARDRLRLPVYVTLDIDVLDPAFAPGTRTPEAGGLTTRELLAIVRGLDIVAADVVEVSPPNDPTGSSAIAAANAAYELVGLLALSTGAHG